MKKITAAIAIILALPLALFASGPSQESVVPPFYNYLSISTGYNAQLAFSPSGCSQAVPLGMATGFLSNNSSGTFALGFGSRVDLEFGIGSDSTDFSLDTVFGLEGMARINSFLALDFMAGLAIGVVDSESASDGSVVTMGPGGVIALRLFPSGFNAISIDAGLAAYGQIGITDRYYGISLVPYVGFTVDFGSFPYAYVPLAMANMLIY